MEEIAKLQLSTSAEGWTRSLSAFIREYDPPSEKEIPDQSTVVMAFEIILGKLVTGSNDCSAPQLGNPNNL